MSRGTRSVSVASQGLSRPFLKTVAAVFPDPTDHLQASKDCKRPPKRQRHSGRLREKKKTLRLSREDFRTHLRHGI